MTADRFFMRRALEIAKEGLARGEFPVGCVITAGGKVIAEAGRSGSSASLPDESSHAEMAALKDFYARPGPPPGTDTTVYVTMEPCLMCFGALLLAGVGRLVYAYEDAMGGAAGISPAAFPSFYRKRWPDVVPGLLRTESLRLFRLFFENPANGYWQNSDLSAYTLNQQI